MTKILSKVGGASVKHVDVKLELEIKATKNASIFLLYRNSLRKEISY